jgi:hypothetical protein
VFWCGRCEKETDREVCPECGQQTSEIPNLEEDGQAKAEWKFGFSKDEDEPKWPLGPDGAPEEAAFLVHTADFGGGGDMTESMLRAFGIPVIGRFPGDGSFGRVVLGFSGYGRELYVPKSRLELAQELLRAPGAEEDPEGTEK